VYLLQIRNCFCWGKYMKKHYMFFFILLLTLVTGRVYYAHSAITPIDETGYSTSNTNTNTTPTPRAAAAQSVTCAADNYTEETFTDAFGYLYPAYTMGTGPDPYHQPVGCYANNTSLICVPNLDLRDNSCTTSSGDTAYYPVCTFSDDQETDLTDYTVYWGDEPIHSGEIQNKLVLKYFPFSNASCCAEGNASGELSIYCENKCDNPEINISLNDGNDSYFKEAENTNITLNKTDYFTNVTCDNSTECSEERTVCIGSNDFYYTSFEATVFRCKDEYTEEFATINHLTKDTPKEEIPSFISCCTEHNGYRSNFACTGYNRCAVFQTDYLNRIKADGGEDPDKIGKLCETTEEQEDDNQYKVSAESGCFNDNDSVDENNIGIGYCKFNSNISPKKFIDCTEDGSIKDYVDVFYDGDKDQVVQEYLPCKINCNQYNSEYYCVGYRKVAPSESCPELEKGTKDKNYGFIVLEYEEITEDDGNYDLYGTDINEEIECGIKTACLGYYTQDYCVNSLNGVVEQEGGNPKLCSDEYYDVDTHGAVYSCICGEEYHDYVTLTTTDGFSHEQIKNADKDKACKAKCSAIDLANDDLECLMFKPSDLASECTDEFLSTLTANSIYNYDSLGPDEKSEPCLDVGEEAYYEASFCLKDNNGEEKRVYYCKPNLGGESIEDVYFPCGDTINEMFYSESEESEESDQDREYTPIPDGYYEKQNFTKLMYGVCYFECDASYDGEYCLAYKKHNDNDICEIIIDKSLDGNARQSNHSKYYSLSDAHTINSDTINNETQDTDDTGAISCVLNNQYFKAGKVYHVCPDYHSQGYCLDYLKGIVDPQNTCTFNELSNLYSEPNNKLYKCTCDTSMLNKNQLQNQSLLVEGIDLDVWIGSVSSQNRCQAECSDDDLIEETDGDQVKGVTDCEKYTAIDILDECSNHKKKVQLYSNNTKTPSNETFIIMKTDGDNPGWYSTLGENELTLYCQESSSLTTFYRFSALLDIDDSIAYPEEFLQDICYGEESGINKTFESKGDFFDDQYIPFYAGCSCPAPYMTKEEICSDDDGEEDPNCEQFGNFHDNDPDDDAREYPDRYKCFYDITKETDKLTTNYRYRKVDCPEHPDNRAFSYQTLDDAWDTEVEQKIIDDKLNTFIGTQLGIKSLTDWKKYYTSAVNICSYAKECTLVNGETKCSSGDTLYADLMLDCEAVLRTLDKLNDDELKGTAEECGGENKAIACKNDTGQTKYICTCSNDFIKPYKGYDKKTDEKTEHICKFGGSTFYLHGGKCPEEKNTTRTVTASPTESEIRTKYGDVSIQTCHKEGTKQQLLTCDPDVYTIQCPEGYEETGNARWCRIGSTEGEEFTENSPKYYHKNDEAIACKKILNICEDKFGNKEPETGDIIKMVDRKTDCVKLYGTGAQVEQCKYGTKTKYHCYYNDIAFSYSTANCPIGRDLTGPYILKNGVKHYDSCDCPVGYRYHEYNCDGELGGRVCTQNGNLTQAFVDKRIANGDNTLKTYHSDIDFYTTCTQPKVDSGSDSGDDTGDEEDGTGSGSGGSGSGSGDDTGDEDLGGDDESGDDILGDDDLGGDDDTGDDILGDDNTGDDEDGTGSGSGGSGSGNIKSTWATCYYCCPAGKSPTGNTRQGTKGREFECK